jgi:protein-L-isoaspartate(D-aspartate) O-methyltransferase
MVSQQLRVWEVSDPRVRAVMSVIPREQFVPDQHRELAFADTSIPLSHGQVMLRPAIEGRLLQSLDLESTHTVLEIGTGSGFLTACLSRLAGSVLTVDIFEDLVQTARGRLSALNIHNVNLAVDDLFKMQFTERYDAIAITGSLPYYAEEFQDWLKPGGKLFIVVGEEPVMRAQRITRVDQRIWTTETLFETVLPPLIQQQYVKRFCF